MRRTHHDRSNLARACRHRHGFRAVRVRAVRAVRVVRVVRVRVVRVVRVRVVRVVRVRVVRVVRAVRDPNRTWAKHRHGCGWEHPRISAGDASPLRVPSHSRRSRHSRSRRSPAFAPFAIQTPIRAVRDPNPHSRRSRSKRPRSKRRVFFIAHGMVYYPANPPVAPL